MARTHHHHHNNNSRHQTLASVLSYAVMSAVFASFVLSADAIRCHQCNSHLDEDCISLRLATPRAPRDDQYLKECEGEHSARAFCRKTVTTLEVSGERRIVRACGWHKSDLRGRNDTCFEADNEGFLSEICACFEDGCNGATYLRAPRGWAVGVASLLAALFAATGFRRNH